MPLTQKQIYDVDHMNRASQNARLGTTIKQIQDDLLNPSLASSLYNVKTFNAKGDGITDDASAIQSAIDSAARNGGGIVYFPPGIYYINSSPRNDTSAIYLPAGYNNITLKGAGKDTSILKQGINAFSLNPYGYHPYHYSTGLIKVNTSQNFEDKSGVVLLPFASAEKGANSITFSTPSNAGSFSEGDIIFMTAGRPTGNTDLGWREMNFVVSSDSTTGEVFLRYPLSKPIDGSAEGTFPGGALNVNGKVILNFALEDITLQGGNLLGLDSIMGLRIQRVKFNVTPNMGTRWHTLASSNELRFVDISECEFYMPDCGEYGWTTMEFGRSCGDMRLHDNIYTANSSQGIGLVNLCCEGGFNICFDHNRVNYTGNSDSEAYDGAIDIGAGWNIRVSNNYITIPSTGRTFGIYAYKGSSDTMTDDLMIEKNYIIMLKNLGSGIKVNCNAVIADNYMEVYSGGIAVGQQYGSRAIVRNNRIKVLANNRTPIDIGAGSHDMIIEGNQIMLGDNVTQVSQNILVENNDLQAQSIQSYNNRYATGQYGDIVLQDPFDEVGFTTESKHTKQSITASGAITINEGLVLLAHNSTPIAATLDAPSAGDELIIVDSSSSGTAAHTVTLSNGITWDGTNKTATFDAPGEALHVIAISSTRFLVLENIGGVAFSA